MRAGFYPNVGKTFTVFASSALKVLKKDITQIIYPENFRESSKIHENCKTFLSRNFRCLWYMYVAIHHDLIVLTYVYAWEDMPADNFVRLVTMCS